MRLQSLPFRPQEVNTPSAVIYAHQQLFEISKNCTPSTDLTSKTMSHELFDATKAIKQGDDISDMPVLQRALFPGKKLPTFNGDPLSDAIEVHDPSMLEGQNGTLFAMTKDQTTFSSMASWFKSIANKDVGDLVNIYHTLLKRLGTYARDVIIFFRPAGVILSETEWVFYHMSTGECSDTLPAGDWTANYVMCCGCYGEKMIQGAPNSFVLYTKDGTTPLKVTVPSITAPSGVAHDFSFDDTGVICHERGNKGNVFFNLTWEALHRKKWDPTNRPVMSVKGRATSVEGLSNPELSFKYDEDHVRFDCMGALDFWLEVAYN